MLSPLGHFVLVMAIVLQRFGELYLSSSHEKKLQQKGAYEIGAQNYMHMKILHTTFFFALMGEAFWHYEPPGKSRMALAVLMIVIGQTLRIYSMLVLGERWATKVFVVPGYPPIRRGLYRYFGHPNYLGVILELWALPMLGGLWWTAIVFALSNFLVLMQRVKLEEMAFTLSEEKL
ncbi:MAG: hypothetical protein HYV97_06835 [Bdellovibrio sp.]|nr:hypothetical protein [Bdellovibrio sp.]